MSERSELESLDRRSLVERAVAVDVPRARTMTRAELIDELLLRGAAGSPDRAAVRRARGLFGVARDLLARMVERGLHLPDAADRIRALGEPPARWDGTPTRWEGMPTAVPTVTLAEIYAAQGHTSRALDTVRTVLARDPQNAAARALAARLESEAYEAPAPVLAPEEEREEAAAQEPVEATVEVRDACTAVAREPGTCVVRWSIRSEVQRHHAARRPSGALGLRAVAFVPSWAGPERREQSVALADAVGEVVLEALPTSGVVHVAVGWAEAGGVFLPIAQAAALDLPGPVSR